MGRTVKVIKEATFDCAHMLTGHSGLCSNLHGHTYKIQVEIEGSLLESGSSEGMVIDFSDLKRIINNVIGKFDHAYIYDDTCGGQAELDIAALLVKNNMRVVGLPFRVTAENMAHYFFDTFNDELGNYYANVSCIRLWETPTSFAEYRG